MLSHGKIAVIALASRGLGLRLLRGEEKFFRDILIAERNYAKTKRGVGGNFRDGKALSHFISIEL